MESAEQRSFFDLVRSATSSVAELSRAEGAMFRAEMRAKVGSAGSSLAMVAGAAVTGALAIIFLSLALYLELALRGVRPSLAALLVAVVAAAATFALVAVARARMRDFTPVPTRTLNSVRRSFASLNGGASHVGSDRKS